MDLNDKYVISLQFDDNIFANYNKIKEFERTSQQRQIDIYALPGEILKEPQSEEDIYKTGQQSAFEDERDAISSIMLIENGQYELVNFIDEIKYAYMTYGDHDLSTGYYVFNDSFSPMYAFTYVTKIYSKVLEYVKELKLYKYDSDATNKSLIFDFLDLK